MPYIVQIISIHLAWIKEPLQFSPFPLYNNFDHSSSNYGLFLKMDVPPKCWLIPPTLYSVKFKRSASNLHFHENLESQTKSI
jgi:hypothetical protein